jgi:hypothetical protein
VSTSHVHSEAKPSHRALTLPRPIVLALALAIFIEIADSFLGPRYRWFLDRLARHTAELYASSSARKAEAFRDRLDQRLQNRKLAPVDWEEAGHGSQV